MAYPAIINFHNLLLMVLTISIHDYPTPVFRVYSRIYDALLKEINSFIFR